MEVLKYIAVFVGGGICFLGLAYVGIILWGIRKGGLG